MIFHNLKLTFRAFAKLGTVTQRPSFAGCPNQESEFASNVLLLSDFRRVDMPEGMTLCDGTIISPEKMKELTEAMVQSYVAEARLERNR